MPPRSSRPRITGYDQEEFTHLAVAATIAAGQADVGFGIAAAAAQYRLDFVPLATEQYCLALRRDHLRDARVVALIDYLASATCRELIGALPGYRASHAGDVVGVDEILPAGIRDGRAQRSAARCASGLTAASVQSRQSVQAVRGGA